MNRNAGRGRKWNRDCHASVSNKSLLEEVTVDINLSSRRKYPLVITFGMDLRRYRLMIVTKEAF